MMTEEAVIKVLEKREKAKQHMNKNNHIKIKERRWKSPRGGPNMSTSPMYVSMLWVCNLEKRRKRI